MPRAKRLVVPKTPHNITQRTVRRLPMFIEDKDRIIYKRYLLEEKKKHQLKIYSYCLMTNHVHLVIEPEDLNGMSLAIKNAHSRYARYFNANHGHVGHLMQSRFYSCPMDEYHFYFAVRYVEKNPVKAGIVNNATSYPWSSAAAHCNLKRDELIDKSPLLESMVPDWGQWLAEENDRCAEDQIKRCTNMGRFCERGTEVSVPNVD